MKKILILVVLFIFSFSLINAQEDEKKLEISGYFMTDQRLLLNADKDWFWNENRLSLQFDKKLIGNSSFHSEVWMRNFGLPKYSKLYSLYSKNTVNPFDIGLIEAYIKVPQFLFSNLDLTVGRQMINWGMADKINPTNSLNPDDFEDILDFGRKRGVDAIKLNYYINNNFSVAGVFVPFYQPTNLPSGPFANVLMQTLQGPSGMQIGAFSDTLVQPENNLKEQMSAGFRFVGFAAGIDFALSYTYGRDFLPQPYYTTLSPINKQYINVDAKLNYPRQHVVGLNMSSNLFGAGVWAEAAMYKYDQDIILTNNASAMAPPGTPDALTIKDTTLISDPYFKFVIGADYHFSGNIYLNFQYIHGFLHERGKDDLNDYYFLKLEKGFFYEKLKIAPLAGAFIVSDYSDLKNNYAYVYMPEVKYMPIENFELTLSTAIIDGKGNNLFSGMKDYDMFIMKIKYFF